MTTKVILTTIHDTRRGLTTDLSGIQPTRKDNNKNTSTRTQQPKPGVELEPKIKYLAIQAECDYFSACHSQQSGKQTKQKKL